MVIGGIIVHAPSVHPQDSSRWQVLQLVDLFVGAIAFHANRTSWAEHGNRLVLQ